MGLQSHSQYLQRGGSRHSPLLRTFLNSFEFRTVLKPEIVQRFDHARLAQLAKVSAVRRNSSRLAHLCQRLQDLTRRLRGTRFGADLDDARVARRALHADTLELFS